MIVLCLLNMGLVAGFVIQRQTNIDQEKRLAAAEATSNAEKQTENATRVGTCFSRASSGPAVQQILDGILTIANVQVDATRTAIQLQPDSDLTPARKRTVARLTKARGALLRFSDRVRVDTPTVTSCKRLAKKLGVDPELVQRVEAGR